MQIGVAVAADPFLWQSFQTDTEHLLEHCTRFCILCIVYYTLYIVYCQSFQTDTEHLLEHCAAVVQQKNSLDREKKLLLHVVEHRAQTESRFVQ